MGGWINMKFWQKTNVNLLFDIVFEVFHYDWILGCIGYFSEKGFLGCPGFLVKDTKNFI